MFTGTNVTHKTYGVGVITDMVVDPANILNSKMEVHFTDPDVVKKFQMKAFKDESLFTTDDPEIISYVREHITEADMPKERKIIRYVESLENEL